MKTGGRRRSESGGGGSGWRLSRIEEEAEKLSLSSNNSQLDNNNDSKDSKDSNASPRCFRHNSLDRSAARSTDRFGNHLAATHAPDLGISSKDPEEASKLKSMPNNQDIVDETISKFFKEKYDSIGPNRLETIYKPPTAGIYRSIEPQGQGSANQQHSMQGQRKEVISVLADQYEPEVAWRNFPPNCISLLSTQEAEQWQQQHQHQLQQQMSNQHYYQKLHHAPPNPRLLSVQNASIGSANQKMQPKQASAHQQNKTVNNFPPQNQGILDAPHGFAESNIVHPKHANSLSFQIYAPHLLPPRNPTNLTGNREQTSTQISTQQFQNSKPQLEEATQRERQNFSPDIQNVKDSNESVNSRCPSTGWLKDPSYSGQHYENCCYDSLEAYTNKERNSGGRENELSRSSLESKMNNMLKTEYEQNLREGPRRSNEKPLDSHPADFTDISYRIGNRDISTFPFLDDEVFEGTETRDESQRSLPRYRDSNASRRINSNDAKRENYDQREDHVDFRDEEISYNQRDSVGSNASINLTLPFNNFTNESINKRPAMLRTLKSGDVSCVSEMFQDEDLLNEDQLVQIEIFYQSRRSEVVVCRCTAQLFLGPPSPLNHRLNQQGQQTPITSRPFDEWAFVKGGVPLLLLDLQDNSLALILAEKGSGFPLWRDQLDRTSSYTALTPTFHALRMSNNPSSVMGLNYQDQTSAIHFLEDIAKFLISTSQHKNKQNSAKQTKPAKKSKPLSKTDISQPCCFTHVTKLGKKADD